MASEVVARTATTTKETTITRTDVFGLVNIFLNDEDSITATTRTKAKVLHPAVAGDGMTASHLSA